jgi:hypothetical protein
MGIFDVFSGKSGRTAAMLAMQNAQNTQSQIDASLKQGKSDAIGALDTAQPLQIGALEQGLAAGRPYFDAARDDYTGASARLAPYVADGRNADSLYADSLGLNGQDGYDNTVAAYRESPGYTAAVHASTDEAQRAASAGGLLASGNMLAEVGKRTADLKDRDFGTWQGQVKGIGDRGFDATKAQTQIDTGRAGVDTAQAGFESAGGSALSGVYGDNARTKAGVYTGLTGMQIGALGETGKATTDALVGGAQAGQKASQNALNFGTTLADLGVKLGVGMWGTPSSLTRKV